MRTAKGRARPASEPDTSYLVPAMTAAQRRCFIALFVLWGAAIGWFWGWWIRPEHVLGAGRFMLASAVLLWLTAMPLYFLANVLRAKRPNEAFQVVSTRVAMVVTRAPSEPFAVVARTLRAMLAQDYAHDTWLADEDPSAETIAWCVLRGVFVSTRRGRPDYHRQTWPRRTRCKEGNLAYFYDQHGYRRYDFVAQLDADHIPSPSYLRHMLAPFADPRVGYVSAPSICDNNAAVSWAARSRLHPEGMFHGPLQVGHTAGGASLCIGSHYAVRTKALKQAGGIGPELAEDHSTSLLISAAGWRGCHAIDAIAHGDGPLTFADMVTQEFQWSRSLMTILLEHSLRYLPKLPAGRRFQFIFCQVWYPLFALFSLVMFLMPLAALSMGKVFAGVSFPAFVLHAVPSALVLIGIVGALNRFGLARPAYAKAISWEGTLFLFFARWPWVLAGTLAALGDRLSGSFVDFRVTPKTGGATSLLPLRVSAPYIALAMVSSAVVLVSSDVRSATGFYWFAAMNALIYALLVVIILLRHIRESGIRIAAVAGRFSLHGSVALATLALPVAAFAVHGLEGLYGLQLGAEPFRLVRALNGVSGAGQGGDARPTYRFDPGWNEPSHPTQQEDHRP